MVQTRETIAHNLAERLCWQAARRDDARVARRLYCKQVVDGVYQLDEGALLDDFFYFLQQLGVVDLLDDVQGTAVQCQMVPCVQYVLLYGLKTLLGIKPTFRIALSAESHFLCVLGAFMISSPAEEVVMLDHPTYRSQVLDHLGLVAGMFDELSIGDVIDHATQQNPAMRDLTVGEAVNAMGLNGLGLINQALYLVPRCFQNQPTSRLIAPRVAPDQRNDDARGRALDTLYDFAVTELYSLIAATAAQRLGLSPLYTHLERTSFHVDGRYHRDEPPAEQVVHSTKGYRRDHRPALNHVMVELIVEPQAGIPGLMKPLSGTSRDSPAFGQVIHTSVDQ